MNRIALITCCGALLLAVSPAVHAAPSANAPKPPFLVVDINKVLNASNEAKALTLKFQGALEEANKNYNSMTDQVKQIISQAQTLQDQYTASASANTTVSTSNRDQIKKDFDSTAQLYQSKQAALAEFKNTADNSLQQTRQLYLQALVTKIRSAATDIAKSRGVGAVVSSETALYYDEDWDISNDVAAALNAAPPTPPPATPALPTSGTTGASTATPAPLGSALPAKPSSAPMAGTSKP